VSHRRNNAYRYGAPQQFEYRTEHDPGPARRVELEGLGWEEFDRTRTAAGTDVFHFRRRKVERAIRRR
jgi:hypothetical protein